MTHDLEHRAGANSAAGPAATLPDIRWEDPETGDRALIASAYDPAARLLRTTIRGTVTLDALRAHMAQEEAAGHFGTRELVDVREATVSLSGAEVRRLVALLDAMAARGPIGPTAMVVASDVAFGIGRMVETLVGDVGVVRPFRRMEEAEAWLRGLPAGE